MARRPVTLAGVEVLYHQSPSDLLVGDLLVHEDSVFPITLLADDGDDVKVTMLNGAWPFDVNLRVMSSDDLTVIRAS